MRNAALPIDWGLVATPFSAVTRYRVCPPGGGRICIYIYIYTHTHTHVLPCLLCASAPLAYRGISRLVLVVVGRMRRDKFRDRSNGDAVSMLLPFAFSTFDTNPFVPDHPPLLPLFISLLGYAPSSCSSSLPFSFWYSSFFFFCYRRLESVGGWRVI